MFAVLFADLVLSPDDSSERLNIESVAVNLVLYIHLIETLPGKMVKSDML